MFIEDIYAVAMNKQDYLPIEGKKEEVTPILFRECRLLKTLHSILVGGGVVLAVSVTSLLHKTSFIGDILVIILTLIIFNVLFDRLSYFLLKRRVKRG